MYPIRNRCGKVVTYQKFVDTYMYNLQAMGLVVGSFAAKLQ